MGIFKTNLNIEEIKKLQKQLEKLSIEESTKQLRPKFLRASKALDELLLKQEIF